MLRKALNFIVATLTFLMAILLIGTTGDLLKKWMGPFASLFGIIVAPIFAPTLIVFPWFQGWVSGQGVNHNAIVIWGAWLLMLLLNVAVNLIDGRQRLGKSQHK